MFSKLMNISRKQGFINHGSYIAQYLALPIFTMGVASTVGVDDLLAAFAAGLHPFCVLRLSVGSDIPTRLCNVLGWALLSTDKR
jgi:hypothetical protein